MCYCIIKENRDEDMRISYVLASGCASSYKSRIKQFKGEHALTAERVEFIISRIKEYAL